MLMPMSTLHLVPADICERYHVKEWRNATGVLATACPAQWQDVQDVLREFRLLKSEVLVGGGDELCLVLGVLPLGLLWHVLGFAIGIPCVLLFVPRCVFPGSQSRVK